MYQEQGSIRLTQLRRRYGKVPQYVADKLILFYYVKLEMEKLILKTCQTRKEISDEALTEILTTSKISYTAEKKAKAINKLLKTGQLMVTNPGDTIMYTYNDDQAAK